MQIFRKLGTRNDFQVFTMHVLNRPEQSTDAQDFDAESQRRKWC